MRTPEAVVPPTDAKLAERQLQVAGTGKGGAAEAQRMDGRSGLGSGSREGLLLLAPEVGLGRACGRGYWQLIMRRVTYEGMESDEEAGEAGREGRPAEARSPRALPG